MKLRKRITAAALSAVMLLSVAVTGADAATLGEPLSFQPAPGAVTVVTDTSGRQTTYDGILDVCRSENSAAIAHIFEIIAKIAKEQGLDNGFRVVTNSGEDGAHPH